MGGILNFMIFIENDICTQVKNLVAQEINTKITLEWVQKQFFNEGTYIILFLTWHNNDKNDDKNDFTHRPRALTGFTFYWWRHNQLLMTSQ